MPPCRLSSSVTVRTFASNSDRVANGRRVGSNQIEVVLRLADHDRAHWMDGPVKDQLPPEDIRQVGIPRCVDGSHGFDVADGSARSAWGIIGCAAPRPEGIADERNQNGCAEHDNGAETNSW